MKKIQLIVLTATMGCLSAWSDPFVGITLSSTTLESLVDSQGNYLINASNESDFVFQIGTFQTGFNPDNTNTESWIANWIVFGQANFNYIPPPVIGFEGGMTESGYSISPEAEQNFDFSGLPAYLWVYNDTNINNQDAEWFLGRADNWVFPDITADPNCPNCGTEDPIQWALSDFSSTDTPVWGGQSLVEGFGEKSTGDLDSFTLQTFNIPEPGSLVLVVIAIGSTLFLGLRRKKGVRS